MILGVEIIFDKNGDEPYNKRGKLGTSIREISEWEEVTPLEGYSKIIKEDSPLWIEDSNIRIDGSKKNLKT